MESLLSKTGILKKKDFDIYIEKDIYIVSAPVPRRIPLGGVLSLQIPFGTKKVPWS